MLVKPVKKHIKDFVYFWAIVETEDDFNHRKTYTAWGLLGRSTATIEDRGYQTFLWSVKQKRKKINKGYTYANDEQCEAMQQQIHAKFFWQGLNS